MLFTRLKVWFIKLLQILKIHNVRDRMHIYPDTFFFNCSHCILSCVHNYTHLSHINRALSTDLPVFRSRLCRIYQHQWQILSQIELHESRFRYLSHICKKFSRPVSTASSTRSFLEIKIRIGINSSSIIYDNILKQQVFFPLSPVFRHIEYYGNTFFINIPSMVYAAHCGYTDLPFRDPDIRSDRTLIDEFYKGLIDNPYKIHILVSRWFFSKSFLSMIDVFIITFLSCIRSKSYHISIFLSCIMKPSLSPTRALFNSAVPVQLWSCHHSPALGKAAFIQNTKMVADTSFPYRYPVHSSCPLSDALLLAHGSQTGYAISLPVSFEPSNQQLLLSFRFTVFILFSILCSDSG